MHEYSKARRRQASAENEQNVCRPSRRITRQCLPFNGSSFASWKKRKKFDPTSIALPADSASSSIAFDEVIPLLPSAPGQSPWSIISTGLTSHQIGVALTRLLSTT